MGDKVKECREKFLKKYDGSVLDDTYDSRDVEWLETDDRLVQAAIGAFKSGGDVNKAVDMLNEVLEFRAKNKLNDLQQSDLNAELRERDAVRFLEGKDTNGYRILIFDVGKSKKGNLVKESYQYVAYMMNTHYRQHPDQKIVLLFDFSNAGVSNLDLDVTKFLVKCTSLYFPSILAYSLMFKMGKPLEAVWIIIKGFLDAEQSKKTYFVTRSNIQTYITAANLPSHMIKEEAKK